MHYEGNPIRPPSEAGSIILQVATGCPHNRCAFCGAYRGLSWRIKPEETIAADLEFASRHCRRQDRLFLADGDCLALPFPFLAALMAKTRHRLPWVKRISLYASGRSIARKSDAELAELKRLGLARVYLGLESGDEELLAEVEKGCTAETMIEGGRRLRKAGLFVSATALLGLAGRQGAKRHARLTGLALSRMRPHQAAFLTLMLVPGTPLHREAAADRFVLPGPEELLAELEEMIKNIAPETRMQVHANHASNYLPLSGRLPRDRERLLAAIKAARTGTTPLKPEHLRAL